MRHQGSILVGLLWCLVLLSVIVMGVLHTASLDMMVGKNYGDRIQARYLALAGVEKAKALLFQDAKDRSHSGKNHSGELYNSPDNFRDVKLGRGEFRVIRRGREDEGGGLIYGVSDEESRMNLNEANLQQLGKLNNISPDIVAAIIDWRDADNDVTPGGAEAEYYMSLQPPYMPRNGPFQTIREMLMVRGVTTDLLFDHDSSQNGLIDFGGADTGPAGNAGAMLEDGGWAAILTLDSSVKNLNAAGDDRVNVQSADEKTLTTVKGITPDIARAIVSYRGQKQLQSIADLLDVTAAQPGGNQPGGNQPNNPGGQPTGPTVIDENLFLDLADDVTVGTDEDFPGAININTAGLTVLATLPGVSRELAQAIISHRASSGFFANLGGLLKVPGMTRDIFKQVAPLVTARSETFRIVSEGKVASSGTRQRMQVIVRVGYKDIQTLSYREDL
jgi:DNA uptake protein ComE-like DNA-binding protein